LHPREAAGQQQKGETQSFHGRRSIRQLTEALRVNECNRDVSPIVIEIHCSDRVRPWSILYCSTTASAAFATGSCNLYCAVMTRRFSASHHCRALSGCGFSQTQCRYFSSEHSLPSSLRQARRGIAPAIGSDPVFAGSLRRHLEHVGANGAASPPPNPRLAVQRYRTSSVSNFRTI